MKTQKCYKTDLHIHSAFSDAGPDWDYTKIANEAIQNDINLIAITDHDVVTNVQYLHEHCTNTRISFLSGVEFSASLDGNLFHILGYGFDWLNKSINDLMQNNLNLEAENNKLRDDTCIKILIQAGFSIDWDEYTSFEGGAEALPGRQFGSKAHNFLFHKEICKDRKDFFERIHPLMANQLPGIPVFPHPNKAIEAIKSAGGVSVLAHPVHRLNKLILQETLELFMLMSIGGVECFRPDYDNDINEPCRRWCSENNLIITGGSDCHGNKMKDRKIGMPKITTDDLTLGVLLDKIVCPAN